MRSSALSGNTGGVKRCGRATKSCQTGSCAVACERAFLAELDGSCKTPIAGHAIIDDDTVQFRGLIARPDGSAAHDISGTGHRKDAVEIGTQAGRELKRLAGPGFFE